MLCYGFLRLEHEYLGVVFFLGDFWVSGKSRKNPFEPARTWRECVQDMTECCELIIRDIKGIEKKRFEINPFVSSFFYVHILLLGESAGDVDRSMRESYSEIDWVYWMNIRNKLAHGQRKEIDYRELWIASKYKVPKLLPLLQRMLEEEEGVNEVSD